MPQTVPLYDSIIQGDVRDWRVRLLVTIPDGETPPAVAPLDAERALTLAYGQSASGPGQGGPVLPSALSVSVFDDDGAVLAALLSYGADQNDAVQVQLDSLAGDGEPDLAYAWRGWLQFALPTPPMFPGVNPPRLDLVATDRLGSFGDLKPFVVADLDPPRAFALDEFYKTVLAERGVDLTAIAFALPLYPATVNTGDATVEALRLSPSVYIAGGETYLQDAFAGSAGEGDETLAAQLAEITEALDCRVWQGITRDSSITSTGAYWCVWSAALMGEQVLGRAAAARTIASGTILTSPVPGTMGLAPVALADTGIVAAATAPISRALTEVVTERSSRVRQYSALTDGAFTYARILEPTFPNEFRYWTLAGVAGVESSVVESPPHALLLPPRPIGGEALAYADLIRVNRGQFLTLSVQLSVFADAVFDEPGGSLALVGVVVSLRGDSGQYYFRNSASANGWFPLSNFPDQRSDRLWGIPIRTGAGVWTRSPVEVLLADNGVPMPEDGVLEFTIGAIHPTGGEQGTTYVDNVSVLLEGAAYTVRVGTPGLPVTVKRSFIGRGSTPWEVKEDDELWYPVDNWVSQEAAETGTYDDLAQLASRRRLARQAALARGIEGTVFGLFPPEQAFTWRGVTYRAARSVSLDLVTEQTTGTWVPKQTSLAADGLPVTPSP